MTITSDQLPDILERHRKWLRDEPGGERAHLSGANLSRADLSGANLYRAHLSGADLYRANLSGANLYRADLSGANLSRAHLSGADLYRANLSGANLYRADLSGAHLSGADLYRADLSGADLSRANLSGANLSGAHLSGANLSGAIYAFASVAFMGHGECGRTLTAIRRKEGDSPELYCGCFTGNDKALRDYIANGLEQYRKTRTLALDTVLMLLDARNDDAALAGGEVGK